MSYKLFLSDTKYSELEDILKPLEDELSITRFDLSNHSYDDILLVLGGDGTLNYLAQMDFQIAPRIIYFPSGTANDFARTLNFSHQELTKKTLEDIKQNSQLLEVPVMKCNDKFFINVATGGAPAAVTNSGSDLLKKLTGKISYYISAIDQFMAPHEYMIEYLDSYKNRVEEKIYGFTISQGIYAGGGVKVSNSTTGMFKDHFNVVIAKAAAMKDSLSDLLQLQNFKVSEYETLHTFDTDHFKIKSLDSTPLILKLDGEECSNSIFKFCKSQKKINFYVY